VSRVGHGVHRAAHRAARAAIQGPVLGSVARVSKWGSRPCNMSVGVRNMHVKVYNMLIHQKSLCLNESNMHVWGIDVPCIACGHYCVCMLTGNVEHVDM
jgi:hypothetical protein